MQDRHIAILGSGIMGSSAALALASCGARITLFEAAGRPFQGASRWNEGKIHLGYLYSADPDLETARHILPGGLEFKGLTERYVGRPVDPVVTTHDDTYLVHRNSVTSVAAMEKYIRDVDALLNGHPQAHDYLVDLTGKRSRRLSAAELDRQYDTKEIVAGFYVPERSVSTFWVADQFVQALAAEPKIELALNTRVEAVRTTEDSLHGPFHIDTDRGSSGPFDLVINCLWEGRPIIDAALGILPPAPWSHRFRLSLFLRTAQPLSVPSTVIATGPFGDIKQYGERDFYLSWYPAGLRAEGTALAPPPMPKLEAGGQDIIEEIFRELGAIIPGVKLLRDKAETMQLNGGWVYASGQGPLSHPDSTLHRRHHTNIHRAGSYISIDTGKYSIAPWLAQRVAAAVCG
jgi:glycine/D-amino acid oxidase-like deaminating enzyme